MSDETLVPAAEPDATLAYVSELLGQIAELEAERDEAYARGASDANKGNGATRWAKLEAVAEAAEAVVDDASDVLIGDERSFDVVVDRSYIGILRELLAAADET